MAANALLDHTRSERLDLGLDFLRQLRVSPAVATLLAEEKPTDQGWGDFAIRSMVSFAFMRRMVAGDFRGAYRLLVRIGAVVADEPAAAPDNRSADLTSVGSPDERQKKPLAKAAR